MDLALNNLQWLICHKTQPNHLIKAGQLNCWNLIKSNVRIHQMNFDCNFLLHRLQSIYLIFVTELRTLTRKEIV